MGGLPRTPLVLALALAACGPVPFPEGGFRSAPHLLGEMAALRGRVHTLRAAGKVDSFGGEQRIQGRAFVFLELPRRLRVEIVSPFGSTLSALTVDGDDFALSDHREGRFLKGPAEPCNIARLVQVPLSPEDAAKLLVGDVPVIPGAPEVRWIDEGRYRVTIRDGDRRQTMDIDPDPDSLALRRSRLEDRGEAVFDVHFDRWRRVGDAHVPHEIRAAMPREGADVLLRYDEGTVEINADLPAEAWSQAFPEGAVVESVLCP
jgi:hypothetical protein